MTEDWDVVIVGAGPAGTAAALGALTAQPSARVLLLDRADFPRDKACGDGIAPHVLDALAEVGVHGLLDDCAPVSRLRLSRGDSVVEREMSRPAYVVPRTVLDARLLGAAVAAGARFRRCPVRQLTPYDGGVIVDGTLRAQVVVGADGAHSRARSAAGLPSVRRRAIAIRGYAPTLPAWSGRQVIVFREGSQPSYAWAFDCGDGRSNVGYGEVLAPGVDGPTRRGMLEALSSLIPGAADSGDQWRAHHLPLSSWAWRQPNGRLLLAGDAAGLVNPTTGEGIYYAVATGVLAGRAAVAALADSRGGDGQGGDCDPGRHYRHAVRRLIGRHLRHTAAVSRLVSRPFVVEAGIAAARKSDLVFQNLVEIGLGRGLLTAETARALFRQAIVSIGQG